MTREEEIDLVMFAYNAGEITTSRRMELLGLKFTQDFNVAYSKWRREQDISSLGDILRFIDTMKCTDDSDRMFKFGYGHAIKEIRQKVEETRGYLS